MADFDKLVDRKGFIINFIEEQARDLFYGETTPYEVPAWAQKFNFLINVSLN